MNTTAEGIDAKGYLIGWMKALTGMYSADINAIPEAEWTKSQGGCSRPANELTADAIGLLIWTTEAIKGNTPTGDGQEEMKAIAAECANPKAATAKLADAVDNLASAIAGASDDTLNKTVDAPWGMPTPLFMICQVAASHIWYHDGQLNYIQCLHGDGKVHWMGD
jgi:hypothetical protein